MGVISVSIGRELMEQVDALMEDGYPSRSEVFRAGIRRLIEDRNSELQGSAKCVLVVSYRKGSDERITRLKHEFSGLIETQMHTHLSEKRCTELFVLSGEGCRIKELIKNLRKAGAEKAVLIPP